jgi:sirohydrochlorin ferrochelatase
MKTALLLIAHGSRHVEANADLLQLVNELRQRGEYAIVEAAYLELAEPSIERGAAECVQQGAKRVMLVPYFLSSGIHVRRDLTEVQQLLSENYPGVAFDLADPLGRHPLLVEVVLDRVHQALKASGKGTDNVE